MSDISDAEEKAADEGGLLFGQCTACYINPTDVPSEQEAERDSAFILRLLPLLLALPICLSLFLEVYSFFLPSPLRLLKEKTTMLSLSNSLILLFGLISAILAVITILVTRQRPYIPPHEDAESLHPPPQQSTAREEDLVLEEMRWRRWCVVKRKQQELGQEVEEAEGTVTGMGMLGYSEMDAA